jgi:hypothetical protein
MVVLGCAIAAAASCARVEAEVSQADVTQKGVTFQGIPGAKLLGEVSTTRSFTMSSDSLSWAKDMNSEVYVNAVEMQAVTGVQDLSFIHFARVTMSDAAADPTVPPVEIINYERQDGAPVSSLLNVKTAQPIDVSQIWAAKSLLVTVQIGAVFPEQNWSADITLRVGGKLSYKL